MALAVVPLVALAACSSSKDDAEGGGASSTSASSTTQKAASSDLTANPWQLVSYNAANGSAPATVQGQDAVLQFAKDGSLSGTTGCNNFAGTYTATGSDLTISLGPMTRRACTDPALTAQEEALTTGLAEVTSYAVEDGTLTLKVGSTVRFTYAAEDTKLEGVWNVTGVNNGTGGLESSARFEAFTLTFGADGKVRARSGCREFVGDYSTTGDDMLSIPDLGSDTSDCPPEAANEPEIDRWIAASNPLGNALEATTNYEVVGGKLTLRDKDGAMQVTANRAGG